MFRWRLCFPYYYCWWWMVVLSIVEVFRSVEGVYSFDTDRVKAITEAKRIWHEHAERHPDLFIQHEHRLHVEDFLTFASMGRRVDHRRGFTYLLPHETSSSSLRVGRLPACVRVDFNQVPPAASRSWSGGGGGGNERSAPFQPPDESERQHHHLQWEGGWRIQLVRAGARHPHPVPQLASNQPVVQVLRFESGTNQQEKTLPCMPTTSSESQVLLFQPQRQHLQPQFRTTSRRRYPEDDHDNPSNSELQHVHDDDDKGEGEEGEEIEATFSLTVWQVVYRVHQSKRIGLCAGVVRIESTLQGQRFAMSTVPGDKAGRSSCWEVVPLAQPRSMWPWLRWTGGAVCLLWAARTMLRPAQCRLTTQSADASSLPFAQYTQLQQKQL